MTSRVLHPKANLANINQISEAMFLITPIMCQYIIVTSLPLPQELTEHTKPGQRDFSYKHKPLSPFVKQLLVIHVRFVLLSTTDHG